MKRQRGRHVRAALRRLNFGTRFFLVAALLITSLTFNANFKSANAATAGSGVCAQTVTSSTGVVVSQISGNCVVKFTSTGSNAWTVPLGVTTVRTLIVGGGGGGGAWVGAGGGGGGFRDISSVSVTAGQSISVTVGAGGTPAISVSGVYSTVGTNGGDSSFSSYTAAGGGKGGSHDPNGGTNYATLKPYAGGSGGGGTGRGGWTNAEYVTLSTGASGNTPATSPSQGYSGGNGYAFSTWVAGGGGGVRGQYS